MSIVRLGPFDGSMVVVVTNVVCDEAMGGDVFCWWRMDRGGTESLEAYYGAAAGCLEMTTGSCLLFLFDSQR